MSSKSSSMSYAAIGIAVISIIASCIAIGLPSWIVVSSGFDDPFSIIDGTYSTQTGLFQVCQVVYDHYDCRNYDGFECIGGPDFSNFCYNRRAAAGLMVSGLILSIIALAVYGAMASKPATSKTGAIVGISLTSLAVIFYLISMGLMINLKRIIQWNAEMSVGPNPWMNMVRVFYGPSFALCITAWILALIAVVFFIVGMASSKPRDHEFKEIH